MLAGAEGSLEKPINTAKLRRDGALMYALLGDPATRLRLPKPLAVRVEQTGAACRWRVTPPLGVPTLHIGVRKAMPTAARPNSTCTARLA